MDNEEVELAGKIVVVPVEWERAADLATALAGKGATVVLVGPDGDAAGRLAGLIESAGSGRPAVFVSDGSVESFDALVNYLAELFRSS